MSDHPTESAPALAPAIAAGVEDLTRTGRLSPAIARTVTARVAWEAYRLGRRDAIRELIPMADAAAQLGITRARVARVATALGVGWQIESGMWLFQPSDIEAIRARPKQPGRPKAGRG